MSGSGALYMPDDWEQKVRAVGAICFRATPDRAATLANLKNALATTPPEGEPRMSCAVKSARLQCARAPLVFRIGAKRG